MRLRVQHEAWPLARAFTISRGTKTQADVVIVELEDGEHTGRGECVPYPRYDETVEGVIGRIESLRGDLEAGMDRQTLTRRLPAGAARNAVDCALWSLEAARAGQRVHQLLGAPAPSPVITAYTLSLGEPEAMETAAAEAAGRPLLKLKLGGDGRDVERVTAVRRGAPDARLIVDANEGCTPDTLAPALEPLAELGVELVEQPLPAGADEALADLPHPVPLCADESCHTADDVAALRQRYDVVNIKLDKTGGLTEALRLRDAARDGGLGIMVGCMVGTSLSMAPALLIAADAQVVDLDGPLLLAKDREPGLVFKGSTIEAAPAALWG